VLVLRNESELHLLRARWARHYVIAFVACRDAREALNLSFARTCRHDPGFRHLEGFFARYKKKKKEKAGRRARAITRPMSQHRRRGRRPSGGRGKEGISQPKSTPGSGWPPCMSKRRRARLCSAGRRRSARAARVGPVLRRAGDLEVLTDEDVMRAAGGEHMDGVRAVAQLQHSVDSP
jgi:hypothetical protein